MLPTKFFIVLIIVSLLITIFILFNDRIIPPDTGTQFNTSFASESEQVETVKVEVSETTFSTSEPTGFQVGSQKDGPSIMDDHCSQCHVAQSLKKFKKSRSEWEFTLTQMESFGVHLSDEERVALLDYLASDVIPLEP